mmetsp:Transcript_59114/g.157044  ORF Transcript_59114/g.157044 Transcript_59114/m.157044 type:complete len:369 (-) Transcript_59114:173-1279(-)
MFGNRKLYFDKYGETSSDKGVALVGAPLLGRVVGKAQFELEILDAPPGSVIQVLMVGMEVARRPALASRFGITRARRVTISNNSCEFAYESGSSGGGFPNALAGWSLPDTVLGIEYDLGESRLGAALHRLKPLPPSAFERPQNLKPWQSFVPPSVGSDWTKLSRFGMGGSRSDVEDAGYFPAIIASAGVRVRFRFGFPADPTPPPFEGNAARPDWPLRFPPASDAHRSVGMLVGQSVLSCGELAAQSQVEASKCLGDLQISPEQLLARLEAVKSEHEQLPPEAFNSDALYLQKLGEIVTTKAGLILKQQLLIDLLKLGANPKLLVALWRSVPESEFAECQDALDKLALIDWCQVRGTEHLVLNVLNSY